MIATTAVVFSDGWNGVLSAVDSTMVNAMKPNNSRQSMTEAKPRHSQVSHPEKI